MTELQHSKDEVRAKGDSPRSHRSKGPWCGIWMFSMNNGEPLQAVKPGDGDHIYFHKDASRSWVRRDDKHTKVEAVR